MGTWISQRSPRPWRLALRQASFRGAPFHVEQIGRQSGRRIALHEFPKRDEPYAEDMGRRTIMFEVVGYLIEGDRKLGMDYRQARNALTIALEKEGAGKLIHPTMDEMDVACDRYSVTEERKLGGYCVFEMHFIEQGKAANAVVTSNTQAGVSSSVNLATSQAGGAFKTAMSTQFGTRT